MMLSARVERIKPSPTLAVSAKADELAAKGQDIVNLGVGEPDFDTPDHIKAAAVAAIAGGFTKYTAVGGTAALKKAVIDKFQRENGLTYHASQILVSSGGKQSFFNLTQAIIDDGDEVVIPAPYWVSYPDIALIAGGKPVIIETTIENRFKITAAQLEKAITPRTKLCVLNSPSNPSGMAYTQKELEALAEVLLKNPHVYIATDDMYEHILWATEPFCNILNVCHDLYDRTFVLNGVSKAYSMTGWRIGYAGGPKDIIAAMTKVQSQSTSNPCSISQKAAEAALNSPQDCVKKMCAAFKERHDYFVKALNSLPGVKCAEGDGTFYAFAYIKDVMAKLNIPNDLAFSEMLLTEAGVAVVPGSAFGSEGYIRMSFATSMQNLEKAIAKMAKVLA